MQVNEITKNDYFLLNFKLHTCATVFLFLQSCTKNDLILKIKKFLHELKTLFWDRRFPENLFFGQAKISLKNFQL